MIPGPAEARERLRELAEARGGYEPLSGLAVSHLAEAAIARAGGRPDREAAELQVACALQELRARRIAMGREPDDERNAVADLACPGCGDISGECGCAEAAAEMEAFDEPLDSDRCFDCGERGAWNEAGEWVGCACDPEPPDADPERIARELLDGLGTELATLACHRLLGLLPRVADPPLVNVEVLRVGPKSDDVLALAARLVCHQETLVLLAACDSIGDVEETLHRREPWLFGGEGEPQNLEGDDPGPLAPGLELVEVAPGVKVARECGSVARIGPLLPCGVHESRLCAITAGHGPADDCSLCRVGGEP